MPSDWLEQTGQLHNSIVKEYGKGTFMHFMMGSKMSKYATLMSSIKSWMGNIITKEFSLWEAEVKELVSQLE